jgi:hypothetical protein
MQNSDLTDRIGADDCIIALANARFDAIACLSGIDPASEKAQECLAVAHNIGACR